MNQGWFNLTFQDYDFIYQAALLASMLANEQDLAIVVA